MDKKDESCENVKCALRECEVFLTGSLSSETIHIATPSVGVHFK